ncbi:hypothetical protein BH23CHL8_BH23CHL8_09390 [soil metagenome]
MDGESWLTGELASFACGACGQAYGEERVRLIAQREELFFVDLACAHCGSQAVAIVSIQLEDPPAAEPDDGGSHAGTDAMAAPQEQEAVSSDDVLDVHRLLADHEGDLRSLLARLDGRAA